jgi:ABC-type Fe3+-hydroxamate transport system substrate-binding protein
VIRLADDLDRVLELPQAAQRIVSLVPSLTETICTLGGDARLAAVTRHCTMPAAGLEHARRVGGTKNPDIAGIIGCRPDVVIVNAEENRKEDFEALERAGLSIFVTYPRRVADVPDLLRRLGRLIAAEAAAKRAAAELDAALAGRSWPLPRSAAERPETGDVERARRRLFCPIWKNPWMTFNGDTFADDLLWLVGAENVFRDRPERYFEIALADVAAKQPEVILLPDEPYVFQQKDLPALATLSDTPAMRDERVFFVDGKALFWYGTRTAAAIAALRRLLAR